MVEGELPQGFGVGVGDGGVTLGGGRLLPGEGMLVIVGRSVHYRSFAMESGTA